MFCLEDGGLGQNCYWVSVYSLAGVVLVVHGGLCGAIVLLITHVIVYTVAGCIQKGKENFPRSKDKRIGPRICGLVTRLQEGYVA